MSKTVKIDLNDYELVQSQEDIEGHTGLIIIPVKTSETDVPTPRYFRKPITVIEIEDVNSAVWYKDIRISKKGTDAEYAERVNWWYDNAIRDKEYTSILNQSYNRNDFPIKKEWEGSRMYLLRQMPSTRKTYIHQFVNKWMNRGMMMHLNRKNQYKR